MMEHIETIELTSSQASIEFTSIPQDYDDLVLLISAKSSKSVSNNDTCHISLNGGNRNATTVGLEGSGSSVSSTTFAAFVGQINANASTPNTFGNLSVYIANYSSTSVSKSISSDAVTEANATTAFQGIFANLFDSTSAITEISFDADEGDFLTGTTASLYGITAGGDGTVTRS